MRRLGEIALTRGFSQEGLAEKLRERFGLSDKVNGANVYGLYGQRPQRETIGRYAEILGVTAEQMQVIEHGALALSIAALA